MPRYRHALSVGLVLLAVGVALGLVLVHEDASSAWGAHLVETVAAWRTPPLSAVMLAVSWLASPPVAVAAVAVWAGVLLLRGRRTAAVSTALVVAAGWGVAILVKHVVGRPRPPVDLVHPLVPEIGSYSFPSGHVAFTTAAGIAAWFLVRGTRSSRVVGGGAVVAVALVGFSRVYLGVHYPGDVLGSLLVTPAAILVLTWAWHAARARWSDRVGERADDRAG